MTYGMRFTCIGRLVATGQISSICCALDAADGRLEPIPIPAFLADKIDPAPDCSEPQED